MTAELTEALANVKKLLGPPEAQGRPLDTQSDFEIEARIGRFVKDRFLSSLPTKSFYRVLKYFMEQEKQGVFQYVPDPIIVGTAEMLGITIYYPNVYIEQTYDMTSPEGRRQSIREAWVPGITQQFPIFYSTKRSAGKVDMTNYYTRVAKAKETNLGVAFAGAGEGPIPEGTAPSSHRLKERSSFVLADQTDTSHPLHAYRVDITHVTGWYINREKWAQALRMEKEARDAMEAAETQAEVEAAKIKAEKARAAKEAAKIPVNAHEIELEIINYPITNVKTQLWDGIVSMLKLLQDSPIAIPSGTMDDVITSFNNLFQDDIDLLTANMRRNDPSWRFRPGRLFNMINKPINLKLRNLDYPSLYAITDKADGERRLMLIRSDGAFLLYPPFDVMKFLRTSATDPRDADLYIDPAVVDKLQNTVFDGELVMREDGKRIYLAFDLIIDQGQDIRNLKFVDRLKRLQDLLNDNQLPVVLKDYVLPDEGNFFDRVEGLLKEIPKKPYGNDGIILNGIMDQYSTRTIVLKWKPPEKLTIDFSIEALATPTDFKLLVKDDKTKKLVMFRGTADYPTAAVLQINPPVIGGMPLKTGQIVECSYDTTTSRYIPHRIRHDRDQPNNKSTADSVWNDIHNPLTLQTITGHDLKVMRRYHNRVKMDALRSCSSGGYILDIGGGCGGDVNKWRQNKLDVLTVEPNPENLKELTNRLQNQGYAETTPGLYVNREAPSRVAILQGGGQETEEIQTTFVQYFPKRPANPVNCVTLFNVLTFFFQDEKMLDSLINTIDQMLAVDGSLHGIVMDGEIVRQIFIPHYYLHERINSLKADQYFNLDSAKAINKKQAKNKKRNETYRLAANDSETLADAVSKLKQPALKEYKESGWSIKKLKWADTPYGNTVEIDLDAKTVSKQTEYLVDFQVFINKLAAKGIILKREEFLVNNDLSLSQQMLSSFYRSFTFTKVKPPAEKAEITVVPLAGGIPAKIREKQDRLKLSLVVQGDTATKLKEHTRAFKQLRAKLRAQQKAGQEISEQDSKQLVSLNTAIKKGKETLRTTSTEISQLEKDIAELKEKLAEAQPEKVTVKPREARRKGIVPKKGVLLRPPKEQPIKPIEPTSAKIKETVTFEDDSFQNEAEDISFLQPGKVEILEFDDVEFLRIGNVRANCLIHAILRGTVEGYEDAPEKKQLKVGQKFFDQFQATIKKTYKKDPSLQFLKQNYKTRSQVANVLEDCENWAALELYDFLGNQFKVKIVVLKQSETDPESVEQTVYSDKHEQAVILYTHGGVFDTLVYPIEED